jgi:hypothetical protein
MNDITLYKETRPSKPIIKRSRRISCCNARAIREACGEQEAAAHLGEYNLEAHILAFTEMKTQICVAIEKCYVADVL